MASRPDDEQNQGSRLWRGMRALIFGDEGDGTLRSEIEAAIDEADAEPPVKLLWETGNVDGKPAGTLLPRAQTRHAAWPLPETRARRWYLHSGGVLDRTRPTGREAADSYRPDPELRPRDNFEGGNIWAATPAYDWQPVVDGASLAYLTAPFNRPVSMAGTGSVDLWISSSATDNDVQVTLSEVLPDGHERYVQSGWLRLSHRKIDPRRSTALNPFHTDHAEDMRPLVPGRLVRARVALFPFIRL